MIKRNLGNFKKHVLETKRERFGMVKIQRKMSPKKYLSKATYIHEYDLLPVPSEFRQTIIPFFEKDFHVSIVLENGELTISYSTKKPDK